MVLTRKEVYKQIDYARDDQERPDIEAEILMMEIHLTKAREYWALTQNYNVYCSILSVVAIGIRCFETYGVPSRGEDDGNRLFLYSKEKEPMERSVIYNIIDIDRNYQESIDYGWGTGNPTISAEIVLMEEYMSYARTKWANGYTSSKESLVNLRHVVAMGVRCLESYGFPENKLYGNK